MLLIQGRTFPNPEQINFRYLGPVRCAAEILLQNVILSADYQRQKVHSYVKLQCKYINELKLKSIVLILCTKIENDFNLNS